MNALVRTLFFFSLVLLLFPVIMNGVFNLGFANNEIAYHYFFISLLALGTLLNNRRGGFFEIRLSAFISLLLFGFALISLLLQNPEYARSSALAALAFVALALLFYLRKLFLKTR